MNQQSIPGFPRRPTLPTYVWVGLGSTTALILTTYYAYLDEVPFTKRKRWIATSPAWEQHLGDREYKNLLAALGPQILPPTHVAAVTVTRVGQRLAAASQILGQQHNLPSSISRRPYTYTVIRSDVANAFVIPGNHVFVMTGLFRYIQDEDDLAAVLGHEAAHNLARHAGEKISGSLLVNALARLSLLLDPTGVMFTFLLPAAGLFRELPNSRQQEMEADQIGVHLAAEACFDPRAAPRFFRKLQDGDHKRGGGAPEFLSTHPSHERRLAKFDDYMPAAIQTFEQDFGNRCAPLRQAMQQARRVAALNAQAREQQEQQQERNKPSFSSPFS